MDDLFFVSQPPLLAHKERGIFLSVCEYLGIPVIVEKTDSGTTLVFLGFELDTIHDNEGSCQVVSITVGANVTGWQSKHCMFCTETRTAVHEMVV